MTNFLTREALLAVQDLQIQELEIEGLPGIIRLRQLSALEMDKYSKKVDITDMERMARFVAFSLVDSQNKKLFNADMSSDIEKLLGKDPATIAKIFAAAVKLNNERENLGEILKNLPGTAIADSNSDSASD